MKKITKIIFLAGIMLCFILLVNSCKKDSNVGYTCSGATTLCGQKTFEACCNSLNCYYKVGTKKYNCDGTDCTAAAEKLVAAECGLSIDLNSLMVSGSAEELLEVVEMLLESNEECLE
jgi:hypothetical protein